MLHSSRSPVYLASFTIDEQDDSRFKSVRFEVDEPDVAPLGLDEPFGDSQPESAPSPSPGVERFADAFHLIRGNTVASIANDQRHRLWLFIGIELDHPSIGRQRTNGLHRIEDDVPEHLNQLKL